MKVENELKQGDFKAVLKRAGKIIKVDGKYSEKVKTAFFLHHESDELLGFEQ